MGLISFLEGAYEGGRLLFLLYYHDKQVKLRYKAIKDSSIKRLPDTSGVIVSESVKPAEKQDMVNQQSNVIVQSSYSTRDVLKDEIKISLAQGFEVTVRNDYILILCLKTGFSEWIHITDNISEGTKLSMINKIKHNLIERRYYISRPLPSNGITSHYADVSVGTFGAIGGLATSACESLIKGVNARKKRVNY